MGTDIFLLFDIPAFPSPIFLSQTWVSLSTCLSTTVPHKAGYSFAASTVLATWLWTRLTSAKVLVTLITDDINDKEAVFLQNTLSDLGAHVSLREVLPYNILDLSCIQLLLLLLAPKRGCLQRFPAHPTHSI